MLKEGEKILQVLWSECIQLWLKLGVVLKEEGFLQVIDVMWSALYIEFTAIGQSDTQRGEKRPFRYCGVNAL